MRRIERFLAVRMPPPLYATMPHCPVCNLHCAEPQPRGLLDGHLVNCSACGQFVITRKASMSFKAHRYENARLYISHKLRWSQRLDASEPVTLTSKLAEVWSEEALVFTPIEQADNLINWLGSRWDGTDQAVPALVAAVAGCLQSQLQALFREMIAAGWITAPVRVDDRFVGLELTFPGWRRFRELQEAQTSTRQAFMAMPFGDDRLNRIFYDHLKPAVARTGFQLTRLDETPSAGLIDDQLRVAIRTSRFLLAELTNQNSGAYWEAGFAEGLGRPVIYLCDTVQWAAKKTHFDTNHRQTIVWDEGNIADAMNRLTAMIRNTLPDEATMTDPCDS